MERISSSPDNQLTGVALQGRVIVSDRAVFFDDSPPPNTLEEFTRLSTAWREGETIPSQAVPVGFIAITQEARKLLLRVPYGDKIADDHPHPLLWHPAIQEMASFSNNC